MSTISESPTTTVAAHFRFGDSTVLIAIRDGLGNIEDLALTRSQTPAEALRSIANGFQDFIDLAEEDRATCLDIRPLIGGATYRASDITGAVTAGIAYIFFHCGFEKQAKNPEIMDYIEALAKIRDELVQSRGKKRRYYGFRSQEGILSALDGRWTLH